jgi:hypothetical protein
MAVERPIDAVCLTEAESFSGDVGEETPRFSRLLCAIDSPNVA